MSYKSRVQAHRVLECLQETKNVSSAAITVWYNKRYPPTKLFNVITGDQNVVELPITEELVQDILEDHCMQRLLLILINCESSVANGFLRRCYTLTKHGASLATIPL